MKKKVKRYTEQIEVGTQNHHFVLKDFSRLLDCQVTVTLHELLIAPHLHECCKVRFKNP